jgi:predicted transcriptional regulator
MEPAQRETFLTTTPLTVDLPDEVKDRLDRLAERTRRNRSLIAGEAIADYVRRELAIIDDIEEARAEVRAGRIVPHDQVMDEVRAIIEEAERSRR